VKAHLMQSLGVAVLLAVIPFAASAGTPPEGVKPSPEVMAYLQEGSRHYLKHDYEDAIGPYAKALELEKQHRTLDPTLWRVLVDNLGMSYGISGALKSAKDTFKYGIQRDKTYPMFYYNLACTYAEMNDLEGSIENLRLAFKYQDNMIAGEQMPVPAKDSSFRRFLKNDRFTKALQEMGRPGR
jgi:tetratricopeptide (TPR) repeat protein